jgi:hypothetical protein
MANDCLNCANLSEACDNACKGWVARPVTVFSAHRQHKIVMAVAILRMLPCKGIALPGVLTLLADGAMTAVKNGDAAHLVRIKRALRKLQDGANVAVAPDAHHALSGVLQLLAP